MYTEEKNFISEHQTCTQRKKTLFQSTKHVHRGKKLYFRAPNMYTEEKNVISEHQTCTQRKKTQ